MDWYYVLPAIRVSLSPHGRLVVLDRHLDTVPLVEGAPAADSPVLYE